MKPQHRNDLANQIAQSTGVKPEKVGEIVQLALEELHRSYKILGTEMESAGMMAQTLTHEMPTPANPSRMLAFTLVPGHLGNVG